MGPKLAAQRRPIHLIPACAVDDDGPVLSVPLSGGDEWRPGQILLSASNQKRTIGYHFRRPGSEVDEYISASGDLKSPMITGGRMFDERALMEVATNVATLAELRKPRSARLWLGEKYLLPSVQGMHVLTIDRRWIVDEVLTVNPALALAAKWARGVGEYFCYSAAVGANGELLPTKPMSQTEIDETEMSCLHRVAPTRRSASTSSRAKYSTLSPIAWPRKCPLSWRGSPTSSPRA